MKGGVCGRGACVAGIRIRMPKSLHNMITWGLRCAYFVDFNQVDNGRYFETTEFSKSTQWMQGKIANLKNMLSEHYTLLVIIMMKWLKSTISGRRPLAPPPGPKFLGKPDKLVCWSHLLQGILDPPWLWSSDVGWVTEGNALFAKKKTERLETWFYNDSERQIVYCRQFLLVSLYPNLKFMRMWSKQPHLLTYYPCEFNPCVSAK